MSSTLTVSFRPLERADFQLLGEWLAEPFVEPWWREPHDLASIEARYGPIVDRGDPTEVFIVERGGEQIGMIQRYLLEDNPDWQRTLAVAPVPLPAAGIDYLIGVTGLVGQGIGPLAIDRFVLATWRRYPSIAAVAVAVAQGNRRSWRALEKSGFERVWAGSLDSEDPADQGPNFVYVRLR